MYQQLTLTTDATINQNDSQGPKKNALLLAIATSAALLTGCQNTHGINTDLAISSGLNAYKAATYIDDGRYH